MLCYVSLFSQASEAFWTRSSYSEDVTTECRREMGWEAHIRKCEVKSARTLSQRSADEGPHDSGKRFSGSAGPLG